jgi:hypothetical protein
MKKIAFSILAMLCVCASIASKAEQPPIIDRALFFGEIQIAGAQISPDGQYPILPQALQRHAQHLG